MELGYINPLPTTPYYYFDCNSAIHSVIYSFNSPSASHLQSFKQSIQPASKQSIRPSVRPAVSQSINQSINHFKIHKAYSYLLISYVSSMVHFSDNAWCTDDKNLIEPNRMFD